jgi:hypothetical protein
MHPMPSQLTPKFTLNSVKADLEFDVRLYFIYHIVSFMCVRPGMWVDLLLD